MMKYKHLVWVYGLFFLFFLQLISDFIESIYVFGLLSTGVTIEIVSVVLLFSPAVLLALRKGLSHTVLLILAVGVLVSRVIAVALSPSAKMVVSGIGVGCWLVVFPAWLQALSRSGANQTEASVTGRAHSLGLGLLLGLAFSALLRMLGAGFDISTYNWTQVLGWVGAVLCLWRIIRKPPELPGETPPAFPKPAFWRVAGLCLGVGSVLLCVYFTFMSPNVIARWTGVPFPLIISVLVIVWGACTWVLMTRPQSLLSIKPRGLLLWNLLFLLFLTLTLKAHQIHFPADISAYPLPEPPVTVAHHIPLFCMLLLSPVVLLDFVFFLEDLLALRPPIRQLGGGFTLATLFMLVLILAQVFTTVYDYIPVIGPWFRDRFYMVFFMVGMGFSVPVLLLKEKQRRRDPAPLFPRPGHLSVWLVILYAMVAITIAWSTVPHPPQPGESRTLRIMTYNIQQGYSEGGVKNFAGQLDVLRDVDPDIIGLQESDTNRIAGGNADIVGYFARKLNMYAYYGPKTVPGTFGIALLSKYPLNTAETFYMFSVGEQTAAIHATIEVGGIDYNVYVTHLGNGGPIEQQRAILKHAQGRDHIIMVGDFNFRPDSEQYALTTASLEDAWLVQDNPAEAGPELDPARRIDHIFVTPGAHIPESRYIVSPASDHPALWAELVW